MIGPSEYQRIKVASDMDRLDGVITKIDESLIKTAGNQLYSWVQVVIDGEYSEELRDEVAKAYAKEGWKKVYHRTSGEHGERAGLTTFVFLTEETYEIWEKSHIINEWHCVR